MSKQLDKLKATMQRIEAQKAELDQKIKAQARKDRNHSIYQRGGELTMHLGDKAEVFTDEDIKLFLNHPPTHPAPSAAWERCRCSRIQQSGCAFA